ncbi:MAG: ChaN family lipoprotein [Proteobacteria bacterium]|nr:ChaN family lipoprotein [Pseudomonadota bacterium]MBU1688801.1 ChaN family lipoprotein [Pseudomonadota bacterium]
MVYKSSLNLFLTTLPLLCCLAIVLSTLPAKGAALSPKHTLALTFDLANSTIRGISTIEFPANSGDLYHMPGFIIESIKINGRMIDLEDRSQPCFADPDHELIIAPTPTPTTVIVIYTLDLSSRTSPLSDLVDESGISLTGVWHPFLHQDVVFQLSVVIPENFEAISEAEEITMSSGLGGKEVNFFFPHPLSGINFIAGPFQVEKTPFHDDIQLYTYFFAEDQDLVESYRDKALVYLDRYEKMIGPFPYKRFSIVENRLPTGYAMPTFTVLGQSVARLPFITETSLGHEILHQWFGNAVRPPHEGGNWTEGLATYLADQLYAVDKGEDVDFRKNQLIRYQAVVPHQSELSLSNFAGVQSHLVPGQESFRAVGYTKSAMVFHMLRQQLGDHAFYQGLGNFYHRMKHQRAGWEDLAASFEEVENQKLSGFFDQWLNRSDVPLLSVKNLTIKEEEGRPMLHFLLKQVFKGTPYQLTVPVTIVTPEGRITQHLTTNEAEKKFEIPLSSRPRELIIDENYDLMRQLTPSEVPPTWVRFQGAPTKLAVVENNSKKTFAPLLGILQEMGCEVMADFEVTNDMIAKGSVIFVGTSSLASRGLFAKPLHQAQGLTVDIRDNPLNPDEVAVLLSADTPEEVQAAAHKIRHYGKYSYLHFDQGRIVEKKITPSAAGQGYLIETPPAGLDLRGNLNLDQITQRMADQRVVYIGEAHTSYEDHLLQLHMIRAMYQQNPDLAIGMEMFNRPAQESIDRYILDQTIDEEEFLRQSHFIATWGYDYRLYRPILNFARRHRIPIIALNLPKEIVSGVYKGQGIDGLSDEDRGGIPADRDLSMPGYRQRISNVFFMHTPHGATLDKLNNFFQAQSLWDETMAETISTYLLANPERRMAVLAGRGHISKENGIPPRVYRRIDLAQSVILNAAQEETTAATADYLIFSPAVAMPSGVVLGVMLKETDKGLLIEKLSPHGKAGDSGVKAEDIILALDDRPVKTVEDLKIILLYKEKGDTIRVRVKRDRFLLPDLTTEIVVPL